MKMNHRVMTEWLTLVLGFPMVFISQQSKEWRGIQLEEAKKLKKLVEKSNLLPAAKWFFLLQIDGYIKSLQVPEVSSGEKPHFDH